VTVALRRCCGRDLDAAILYDLLTLRIEVFVVEQACPYPDLDGSDLLAQTRHFWLEEESGEVIATLRLIEEGLIDEAPIEGNPGGRRQFRIGRVCTRAAARGHGYATRLLQAALADVGADPCALNAQTYLIDMYARHGFVVDGDEFCEDGIPHVPMRRMQHS
jgi:ElaA protein